jgi:hypothetical protein
MSPLDKLDLAWTAFLIWMALYLIAVILEEIEKKGKLRWQKKN